MEASNIVVSQSFPTWNWVRTGLRHKTKEHSSSRTRLANWNSG